MERFACFVIALLSSCAADAQAQSFNTVPRLSDPPLVDYTRAPERPAATIQSTPTNSVPAATIQGMPATSKPAPLASPDLEPSTIGKFVEKGLDVAADTLDDAGELGKVARKASKLAPVASVVINGTSAVSSLYRAGRCAAKGDMDGHDRAWGEAKYEALEAIPGVDLALACADIIGSKVFDVKVKDFLVSSYAQQKKQERQMEALGFYEGHPLYDLGASPYHNWIPPDSGRARRSGAHQATVQGNQQAAANRAAMTQESGAWNDPQFTQMMWMLMPAAIAASQPRAGQPPVAAPQSPLPPLQWQTQCYGDGRKLGTAEMGPTHCQQVPVYPGRTPRNDVPPPGATIDTRTWPK